MRPFVKRIAATAGTLLAVLAVFAGAVRAAAPAVADQAGELAAAMKAEFAKAKPAWKAEQVDEYVAAYREALAATLTDPLDAPALAALKEGQANWVRHSVAASVGKQDLEQGIAALRFSVEAYAARKPTTDEEQERIDKQIDEWCETIESAVEREFVAEDDETLKATMAIIRQALRRDSRNVLFPGLKPQGGGAPSLAELRQAIAKQARDLAGRAPPKPGVDWRVTTAWMAVTRAVSKTITPPKGQALYIKWAPGSTGIRLEIGQSFLEPAPKPAGEPDGDGGK